MVAVERTSRYAELTCSICHERFKPGDLVLPSIHKGEQRVVHAHVCKPAAERDTTHRLEIAAVA